MSDMMEFPKTVEEFMEQYKVVDTDHIYSNGTVFVPIFRMKQWFDHVESENDHVEVVRGEWIEKWRIKPNGTPYHIIGDMECSVCHSDMLGRYYSRYCPNCGAKMEKGAER